MKITLLMQGLGRELTTNATMEAAYSWRPLKVDGRLSVQCWRRCLSSVYGPLWHAAEGVGS